MRSVNRTSLLFAAACFILLSSLATPLYASTGPEPMDQLRPFIEKVIKVLTSEEERKKPKAEFRENITRLAEERFDFQEMSKRVLGRHWRDISTEERDAFQQLFKTLLQHAYVGRIEEYAGQEIEYLKQRIKGKRAEVRTNILDAGKTIPVSYIMLLKQDQWYVYDVVVEGVSLIRNYKEQFSRIINDEGYPSLVAKIEEKIKKIESEPADA